MTHDHALVTATLACALAGVVSLGERAPRLRARREHRGYAGDGSRGEVDITADGVQVRFAWSTAAPGDGAADFAELALAALPGVYRLDAFVVDGESLADVQRRVVAVQDRLLDAADGALRVVSDRGPPVLELDLRGLPAPVAAVRTISLRIAREAVTDEFLRLVKERLDTSAEVDAARSRHLADVLLAQAEVVDRTSRDASGQRMQLSAAVHADGDATRALVSSWAERQAGMPDDLRAARAALASLEAGMQQAGEMRTTASARVEAIEGELARLSSLVAALDTRVHARLEGVEGELARLPLLVAALDARLRERDDAASAAASRLEARVAHVSWSMENVFWRRWLRRLRGPRP